MFHEGFIVINVQVSQNIGQLKSLWKAIVIIIFTSAQTSSTRPKSEFVFRRLSSIEDTLGLKIQKSGTFTGPKNSPSTMFIKTTESQLDKSLTILEPITKYFFPYLSYAAKTISTGILKNTKKSLKNKAKRNKPNSKFLF